jgi:hypothetical protein
LSNKDKTDVEKSLNIDPTSEVKVIETNDDLTTPMVQVEKKVGLGQIGGGGGRVKGW